MLSKVQDGRVAKSHSPRKHTNDSMPYFFIPTEYNRRTQPYSMNPYIFDFGKYNGLTFHEIFHDMQDQRYLIEFILGDDFTIHERPELEIALRSQDHGYYYQDGAIGMVMARRGFSRKLECVGDVLLSIDANEFDEFIELQSMKRVWDLDSDKPDIVFDETHFEEHCFKTLPVDEASELRDHPIKVSFYAIPTRLERLDLGEVDGQSFLSVIPLGWRGTRGSEYTHVVVRIDETGKEMDYAEELIGQPLRVFGALQSTQMEDICLSHCEEVPESALRKGIFFEMRARVRTVEGRVVTAQLNWKDGKFRSGISAGVSPVISRFDLVLGDELQAPTVDSVYTFKGIISPATSFLKRRPNIRQGEFKVYKYEIIDVD